MINLEWFRTFKAIYECENITKASSQLNMTQPGVSKHLSALESHIGKTLFNRTTRKLEPTEYGKFLYAQVNYPLRELEKVEYYSNQRTKKDRFAITIGCTSDFFKEELRHRIYDFDMYIVTVFGNEKTLIEALEAEQVQLLVGVREYNTYNHQFIFLKREDLVLIGSKDIQIPEGLIQDEKRCVTWLQRQPWFAFDNDQSEIKKFWEANFSMEPKIVPRYILPSHLDIIETIKHHEGLGIVPRHLCKEALDNKKMLSLPHLNTVKQKRYYAYKLKNSSSKEINSFIEKMSQGI